MVEVLTILWHYARASPATVDAFKRVMSSKTRPKFRRKYADAGVLKPYASALVGKVLKNVEEVGSRFALFL